MPQYNGKEIYDKAFEFCKTPEEDRTFIRNFERPSKEQGKCFSKYLITTMEMMKEDNTLNAEKVAQQFTDYGLEAPEETKKMGGVSIDDDAFTDKFFNFMKNHRRDISFVFHGDYEAKF